MAWRERLLDHAKLLGRQTWVSDAGIGIDFEDGCDSFWVLPGEVTSTIPVPAGGPAAVGDQLADEYLRRHADRAAVLNAITQAGPERGWARDVFGGIALFGVGAAPHPGGSSIYRSWLADVQVAMAVAWTCCQPHLQ